MKKMETRVFLCLTERGRKVAGWAFPTSSVPDVGDSVVLGRGAIPNVGDFVGVVSDKSWIWGADRVTVYVTVERSRTHASKETEAEAAGTAEI